MEGILSVFKFIEKKIGRFWTVVIEIREKIKAAAVDEAHLIENGNKFYSSSFHNKHIDTLELYTL